MENFHRDKIMDFLVQPWFIRKKFEYLQNGEFELKEIKHNIWLEFHVELKNLIFSSDIWIELVYTCFW